MAPLFIRVPLSVPLCRILQCILCLPEHPHQGRQWIATALTTAEAALHHFVGGSDIVEVTLAVVLHDAGLLWINFGPVGLSAGKDDLDALNHAFGIVGTHQNSGSVLQGEHRILLLEV